jgi:D-alanyl-D-alanine dipeptidase
VCCDLNRWLKCVLQKFKNSYPNAHHKEGKCKSQNILHRPNYRSKFKLFRKLKIYNKYYNQIKQEYPYLKDPELIERVEQFISKPGPNYLHGTGGAIDVTLVDDNGNDLDMGTQFDEFNNKTRTDYFEHRYNLRILFNRRILYDAMINAGFVNNPEEWWHFDYGDAIWAVLTNNKIKYKSVFDIGEIYA